MHSPADLCVYTALLQMCQILFVGLKTIFIQVVAKEASQMYLLLLTSLFLSPELTHMSCLEADSGELTESSLLCSDFEAVIIAR